MSTQINLPIIDISPFLTPSSTKDKAAIAEQLNQACLEFGAFFLQNHNIDNKNVLGKMTEFFNLSQDVKESIAIQPGGFTRGYIGMGEESGSDALEVKEAFSYGYPWPTGKKPDNKMQGENVWPKTFGLSIDWRNSMEDFFEKMCTIAHGLTRAFSISYGKEEGHLGKYCSEGDTISLMRLFHYFPYHRADGKFPQNSDRIGSSPHTDWGFLTLILQQEDTTGLQIFHNNEWKDLVPVPDTLVVNCGDYFSLLTGGKYKSPLHRVVSEGKERISGVMFYYPDFDARIPLLGNQDYSIFKDQKLHGGMTNVNTLENLSFGEFISEKWLQVQRKDV